MANVKHIDIGGEVPFNIWCQHDAKGYWASFSAPAINLHITYGTHRWVPNTEIKPDHDWPNGQTLMYQFQLSGFEALSWGWFDGFYAVVEKYGGTITHKNVIDPEDD